MSKYNPNRKDMVMTLMKYSLMEKALWSQWKRHGFMRDFSEW